uniref:MARVEL domain-containing protein n=1 Tax=Steinernema glaseri TaxID=37863 RepID=A0A1I8A3I1_9BILA
MAQVITWCVRPYAAAKWLQLLCFFLIVIFLLDGRIQWWPYTAIFIGSILGGIIVAVLLLIGFFEISRSLAAKMPWLTIEFFINVALLVFTLVASGILVFDYFKMLGGEFQHHKYTPPANIGKDGWKMRILVVLVSMLMAVLAFLYSTLQAKKRAR